MSFFDKAAGKNAAASNNGRSPRKTEPKKVAKAVILEEIGRLVLADEESFEFKNEMFGDIATILETYNSFIHLYFTRSKKLTKVDCKKIEYNHFIQMLKYDTKEAKESFVKLLKNLLIILIEHESAFDVIEFYS